MLPYTDVQIAAGKIVRHPLIQRKSQLRRWERRCGKFDIDKVVEPIHVVSDGNGAYFCVDGGHRVEACRKDKSFGLATLLPCRLWGNGDVPPNPELATLFLLLNHRVITVGAGTAFVQALHANETEAAFALQQQHRLGRGFRTITTVWVTTLRDGQSRVKATIDFMVSIWGNTAAIPGAIFSAIHDILGDPRKATSLRARRSLKDKKPAEIYSQAQRKRLMVVGRRATIRSYIVAELLGSRRPK